MMRLAGGERWRMIPAGAGTWLEMGAQSTRFDLIVSTAKMIVQQAFDFHIETYVSLAIIGVILAVSIAASLLWGDSGPDDSDSAAPLAEPVRDAVRDEA